MSKTHTATGALKPNRKFQAEIQATSFSIFEPVADLGYFGWKPNHPYKTLANVTAREMIESIQLAVTPNKVISPNEINCMLPMHFETLSPQAIICKYPNNHYDLASLHVALKHRNIDTVDFFFGGSTLEILAQRAIPHDSQYLATKVPGTDIIMVHKHKEYVQDYSNIGFQFERLVTGKTFRDRHREHHVEHMQLMKVAGYRVLFSAEMDAADDSGNPVEIKVSNPMYWGTKTMFQMISNGSSNLIVGTKSYGALYSVNMEDLSTVAMTTLVGTNVRMLESNIRDGLEALNRQSGCFNDGKIFEISFDNDLQLSPFSGDKNVLLPANEVVEEMLS